MFQDRDEHLKWNLKKKYLWGVFKKNKLRSVFEDGKNYSIRVRDYHC